MTGEKATCRYCDQEITYYDKVSDDPTETWGWGTQDKNDEFFVDFQCPSNQAHDDGGVFPSHQPVVAVTDEEVDEMKTMLTDIAERTDDG